MLKFIIKKRLRRHGRRQSLQCACVKNGWSSRQSTVYLVILLILPTVVGNYNNLIHQSIILIYLLMDSVTLIIFLTIYYVLSLTLSLPRLTLSLSFAVFLFPSFSLSLTLSYL